MEPMIQVVDVWFRYQGENESSGKWALKKINLTFRTGEYVSIIGANGSGKSTLARLLNGLLLPVRGEVKVGGLSTANESDLWEIRRRVGMVFQNPDNQIVATTVEDDVAFGLENLGVPRSEMKDRIERALAAVGLSGMNAREPHHLSGGQKQRLALAGVLAMSPDVIVLDEATSMLDPQGKNDVSQVAAELHRMGKTIIHITHSAREAFRAERVIVMNQGEVKLDLPSEVLYPKAVMLKQWGLAVPPEIELHQRLLGKGWPLSPTISGKEELVEEIWRSLSEI
ncbi:MULTISPECIES: energy-coupling factor transporter ATPase [Thermoactinomyces]|jgi:energy-coupling factor transport system ATP-binding protein|uniref:Energy-coupling factor transporter ATPase n=2 Tax=Thermoactinomyces TaxID=2023 RepID=A0A7W1X905_9BACL|nr:MULTISPECIES: energy-coupling factor transporter ATPase [Thermoactinomyces]MBA4542327.1 energy-coupling factor transporter ATPase [Thermoactinomyces daqus]MBH8598886.1 energy-coupling factor transporter ATPase [Thermoactinomyces sp. CICC 10523]MBH8604871.1 energy-coupling factor transporter ATPase [Thermoactinomyces sp. CICC 10522]MBH8607303.1 energy-coupling factor transporter ATPase [Thermoactinomyces sp. CICC 10521]